MIVDIGKPIGSICSSIVMFCIAELYVYQVIKKEQDRKWIYRLSTLVNLVNPYLDGYILKQVVVAARSIAQN